MNNRLFTNIVLALLFGFVVLSFEFVLRDTDKIIKRQEAIERQLNDVVREIQLTHAGYADREYRVITNAMSEIKVLEDFLKDPEFRRKYEEAKRIPDEYMEGVK